MLVPYKQDATERFTMDGNWPARTGLRVAVWVAMAWFLATAWEAKAQGTDTESILSLIHI